MVYEHKDIVLLIPEDHVSKYAKTASWSETRGKKKDQRPMRLAKFFFFIFIDYFVILFVFPFSNTFWEVFLKNYTINM